MPIRPILACLLLASFTGCATHSGINAYDDVIDKGSVELTERINAHVRNMGDLAGKVEGSYESNITTYNAINAKLDVMVVRAEATASGQACAMTLALKDQVQNALKSALPVPINEAKQGLVVAGAAGCDVALLRLVQSQLDSIRTIHQNLDKCGATQITCLRPATAKTALNLINRSLAAIMMVETAKKRMGM